MKKEAKYLLERAINSLILSIELFNRPWDRGRPEAVLIFLDHAFEMLLKAAILHRGGKIREPKAKETIGFDHCVRKVISDSSVKFLAEEQALLLQSINSLRDAAQHHLLSISEPHLYIQAQAGLTLFKDIYLSVFDASLYQVLPERVLPLSTAPPQDLTALFDSEVEQVKVLLQPGARRGVEVEAKLRGLAIMEAAIVGERLQPSLSELSKIKRRIKSGETWSEIFPGVASIDITHKGYGPSIDLRITKREGIPIHVVPEGSPSARVVGIKRVNELDYYSLGMTQIAEKSGLTQPKASAIVRHLKLKDDVDCYKKIRIGKFEFERYSPKALDAIKKAIMGDPNLVEHSWSEYKSLKGKKQ
ncbi:MAG: hypothetical protein HY910_05810 [Desulfarculus sp.]|nr:hypothetical protein [Desulfarculus sp.]